MITLGRARPKGYFRTMDELIYRLMDQTTWFNTKRTGVFAGGEDDRRDGFIHFSTAGTVRETARRYYTDVADLLLLSVFTKSLGDDLKWEPSRGGALFPHLYAPLRATFIHKAVHLERDSKGHVFGRAFA